MTYQEGLELAKLYHLENEYNACIVDDMSVEEVLNELNIKLLNGKCYESLLCF